MSWTNGIAQLVVRMPECLRIPSNSNWFAPVDAVLLGPQGNLHDSRTVLYSNVKITTTNNENESTRTAYVRISPLYKTALYPSLVSYRLQTDTVHC